MKKIDKCWSLQQCAKSATNVKCGRKFRSRLYCPPSFVSATAHHFHAVCKKNKDRIQRKYLHHDLSVPCYCFAFGCHFNLSTVLFSQRIWLGKAIWWRDMLNNDLNRDISMSALSWDHIILHHGISQRPHWVWPWEFRRGLQASSPHLSSSVAAAAAATQHHG